MKSNVTMIGSTFSVVYDLFANFPPAPPEMTLAYATDTGILYRWNGAAWQAITAAGGYVELAEAAHEITSHIAWEAWDLSAVVPAGATAVDLMCFTNDNMVLVGARMTGSALVRSFTTGIRALSFIVPLTATRIIEIYDDDNTGVGCQWHVVGYWT